MAGGRPPKEISKKAFENLCGLQCTKEEICCFFDITDKTLEGWCKRTYCMGFSEVFAIKRGTGKISLRRSQFRLAEKNAAMAIFLGQQYLGQRNYSAVESTNETIIKLADDPLSASLKNLAGELDAD